MNQLAMETETWEEKTRRLALEVKAARPDPFKSSPKQRATYRRLRYALMLHLESVE